MQRPPITLPQHAIEELADLGTVQYVRHTRLAIGIYHVRDEPGQPQVTIREAGHVVDMLRRHGRIPAVDYSSHHRCVEWLNLQFRYPLGSWS